MVQPNSSLLRSARVRRRGAGLVVAGAGAVALALAGCTVGSGPPSSPAGQPPTPTMGVLSDLPAPSGTPRGAAPAPLDPAASLTPGGVALAQGVDWATRPAYHVIATLDPAAGRVDGTVTATLRVGDDDEAVFRYFPGLDELASDAKVTAVTVDGAPVEPVENQSLITVALPGGHGDAVQVALEFGYSLEEILPADPFGGLLGGDSLAPEAIGLLARHDGGLSLGHWFPLWMPQADGVSAVPDGFGDIGNFPAAMISAELTVPAGATVVTGGVRVDSSTDGDSLVVRDEGIGLRDLGAVVLTDVATVTEEVGGVTVSVVGPAGGPDEETILAEVLAESTTSLRALEAAFGAYPWQELDVIATPLGSGVGGMEWPGAVWIEQTIFAGRLPGLGDLGDLFGDDSGPLADLLDELTDDGGGLGGLGGLIDPAVIENVRSWTIAHEVGHQWWHALVGNDSATSPAVDEPLAQYAACVVFRTAWPEVADPVCIGNTTGTYQQMRLFGIQDTAAAQASNAFDSSLQYGGVVYGKAPGLYLALDETYGEEAVVSALRAFVASHPFALVDTDGLRTELGAVLGEPAAVDALWQRWLHEAHGDEDIGVLEDGLGGLGDLFGDDGGATPTDTELLELLEELLG